jgi:hypothetical protein
MIPTTRAGNTVEQCYEHLQDQHNGGYTEHKDQRIYINHNKIHSKRVMTRAIVEISLNLKGDMMELPLKFKCVVRVDVIDDRNATLNS